MRCFSRKLAFGLASLTLTACVEQAVYEFEVPEDLVIELIKGTKGRFHHRGLTERDIKLSADDAARLFKPDSTYTVELFEV